MRSDHIELMSTENLKKAIRKETKLTFAPGLCGLGSGPGGNRPFSLCVGCGGQIHDQYILRVAPNLEWHAACLKCCECQMFLDETHTCFVREGKTFCKKDYVRLFGAKCDKCLLSFGKNDYVMRAKSKIFHQSCFQCVACGKRLVPGDEFALKHDELFCKEDSNLDKKETIENNNNNILQHHNTSNSSEDNSEAQCDFSDEDMSIVDSQEDIGLPGSVSSGSGGISGKHKGAHSGLSGSKKGGDRKSARARTVLSEKQLNILKTCYSANPRPDALMKEQLVEMTGLSPRVIRVWFQNKRCKDKKIQNRMMEKQMQRETDGRKMGYGAMHGIPMVASSPVRHESPVGMNPVEIQSYEPPWKALTDFALHTDLDRLNPNTPHFQHLVNQMHGYPDMPPPPHEMGLPPPPPSSGGDLTPYHPAEMQPPPSGSNPNFPPSGQPDASQSDLTYMENANPNSTPARDDELTPPGLIPNPSDNPV